MADSMRTMTADDVISQQEQHIARLESELDDMTAALSQAWDQLVPFLNEVPQPGDASHEILPFLEATLVATDTHVALVYLLEQDEWLVAPSHLSLSHTARQHFKDSFLQTQRKDYYLVDVPERKEIWMFITLVTEQSHAGMIGIGLPKGTREFSALDVRILKRMSERVASQLLAAQLAHVREREARLQHELEIAGAIQRSIQPVDKPVVPGMQMSAIWQPARRVGGDAWGWVQQPCGKLCWFLLDVSGKGLSAALAAVSLHTAIHMALRLDMPPVKALQTINEEFYNTLTKTRLFATVVVVALDPETLMIEQANAGHLPTLIRQANSWIRLEATEPPLGVLPDIKPEAQHLQLNQDDLILCYSDGYTEITTADGLWDVTGLMNAIPSDLINPEAVADRINAAADSVRLSQEIHDDQTAIVVSMR
ncbi:MAG: hypothetical protein CL610_16935 [Anaerolineaceae bacterium]|nr:hypothetical protein [Anaerolineaceae bacterium]